MTSSNTRDLAQDLDSLRSDLAAIKNDLAALGRTAVERGKKRAVAAKENVEERVSEAMHTIEDFVHERPFCSAGIAFGAGVLTALLLRRR